MLLLLLSVSLAFLKSGFLLGAIFLLLAADLFVHAVAPESAWMARCVLFGLVILIPLSSYMAGCILDCVGAEHGQSNLFATFAIGLSLCLVLQPQALVNNASQLAAVIAGEHSVLTLLTCISDLISTGFYCTATVALALVLVSLAIEIPCHWLQGTLNAESRQYSVASQVSGLRMVFLLGIAALAFNLIVGFFGQALWTSSVTAVLQRL